MTSAVVMHDLICPVCGARLTLLDRALQCPRAHSFDIAREGYVNLRIATGKAPKFLGDSRDMLLARRAFFEQGHYAPLSDALNVQVQQLLNDAPSVVVDVGCGEGYFLRGLKHCLDAHELDTRCYGVDVAKDALKLAAKQSRDIAFVVADVTRQLPFADQDVTLLLNMFAPRSPTEFARVVRPGGWLVVVIPAPEHLLELRHSLHLLSIEEAKAEKVVSAFSEQFRLLKTQTVSYPLHLNQTDTARLIHMTPNDRHLSDATLKLIESQEVWDTTAAFLILVFQKSGA